MKANTPATEAMPKPSPETPPALPWYSPSILWQRKATIIATFSIGCILAHLLLRFGFRVAPATFEIPLLATLIFGGLPFLYDLLRKLLKREFGSDLLGGISIITSVLLGEYLAGSIIRSLVRSSSARRAQRPTRRISAEGHS
jgi:cation transport ATPase